MLLWSRVGGSLFEHHVAMVKGWWLAFDHHVAMVKGWWLVIDHHVAMVKGWGLAINTFFRRTLSRSFRENILLLTIF